MKKKYIAPQTDVLTTVTEGHLLQQTHWQAVRVDGTTDTSVTSGGQIINGNPDPNSGIYFTAKHNSAWAFDDDLSDDLNDNFR